MSMIGKLLRKTKYVEPFGIVGNVPAKVILNVFHK